MGKNSRAKKPKSGKVYTINDKQLERVKRIVADDITKKVMLLVTCAMVDELGEGATEEYIEKFVKRTQRYALNLDAHLFRMRDLGESIYKQTGVDWRGW